MPTRSPQKNEINVNTFNLDVVPSEFPTGIFEFFKFNFFNPGKKNYQVLHPFNLSKKIETRLRRLCLELDWLDNHTVIKKLNLPFDEYLRHNPFNFKYVYEYVLEYKTYQYDEELDLDDDVLIRPVNQKKFKTFYSI